MVNSVSSYSNGAANLYRTASANYVLNKNDVENLIKFNSGLPVALTPEPTIGETVKGTLPFLGIFGGFQGISALKANSWSLKNTINAVNSASAFTARSQALAAGKAAVVKEYGDILKKVVTPNSTRMPVIHKLLDKIPGYTKLRSTGFGKAMGHSGAGFMAVMDGISETFTQVAPAFKIGTAEGFKQIGKSTVKVVAGAGGWLAGDALGKGIGAAIGTAICPGIGTAIGTFVGGFLGGMVGSAVAGKAAKAITGKTEVEKYQEKQIAQTAQQVEADPNTKIALAQQALQQAQQVLTQDPSNADALATKASAEAILASTAAPVETAVDAQQAYQPQQMTQMAQMSPSFTGNYNQFGIPVVPGFNGFGYDMNVLSQAMAKASAPNYNMNYGQMTNPFMPQFPQVNYNQPASV